jgi:hypothetical protein
MICPLIIRRKFMSKRELLVGLSVVFMLLLAWFLTPSPVSAAVNCSDPGVICKSGILAGNETWTASNIYVITGSDLTIPLNIILTIQAGTIIKLDLGRSILVDGKLNATGASSTIYFTSIRDPLGGNTNHDPTLPAPGDWGRINYRNGGQGTLSHVEMRYGGNAYFNAWGMLQADAGAAVTVDTGIFKNASYCAISSDPSYEVTITNTGNANFTGSTYNGQCIRSGSLGASAVWDEANVSYVILGDVTVPYGITLTWGSGIVIKPASEGVGIYVDGILNANGTAPAPIYVTSINDRSIGGNTNNNANLAAAGDWGRINYRNGGQGTLSHVEMLYGAGPGYLGWGMLQADAGATLAVDAGVFKNGNIGIFLNGASSTIQFSIITNNTQDGIQAQSSNPILTCNDIQNNNALGLRNNTPTTIINAVNQYWGASSGPNNPTSNPTGTGNGVSDGVTFIPWRKGACMIIPPPPINVQASEGTFTNKVVIIWTPASGADPDHYEVYRADSANGTYSLIGSPTNLSFEDTDVAESFSYYYKVKACSLFGGCSFYSTPPASGWVGKPFTLGNLFLPLIYRP